MKNTQYPWESFTSSVFHETHREGLFTRTDWITSPSAARSFSNSPFDW